jgi:diguanylate cyclase (GGDEF)-like protein
MRTNMMTDPRVAELEFLAVLDSQRESLTVTADTHASFGIPPDRFKDMVIDLIYENCAAGTDRESDTYVDGSIKDPRAQLWAASAVTIGKVLRGTFPYSLRITHPGRLRSTRLREELDRGRISDQTGILLDGRHIDRDLRVRFAMAGPGAPVGLMMADLDHFKLVNDTLGHGRGDDAIRRYFSVLRDIVGSHDGDAYRRGGDETIAILPNADKSRSEIVAESTRRAIEVEFSAFDERLPKPPTVSIGIASFAKPVDSRCALERVDGLLYRAKHEGKNRFVVEVIE